MLHEFLYSLECTGCFGSHNGWHPRYFLLWSSEEQDTRQLLAAAPAYIKTNSYGEFVFDWAWAEAYQRHNLDYYPKLVCSIPFTPATGPRLLVRPDQDFDYYAKLLASAMQQFAVSENFSSVHWLFLEKQTSDLLSGPEADNSNQTDLLRRIDCQYHWQNNGYGSFEDFLSGCTSKRRKTIRRERRHVSDAKLRLDRRAGDTLTDQEWRWVHQLYESTYERKWGNPNLTLEFFIRAGKTMGAKMLIVLVYSPEDKANIGMPIACSIMFVGGSTLYGRFWGCREAHNSLHFEACYYQGIDYCIEHDIAVFEPGAQGEHKITRGFEPTITRSAHYIAQPEFRNAIADFLDEETKYVQQRCEGLTNLLPFKSEVSLEE